MKARFVAGLLASFLVLSAASAGAAPKKGGAKPAAAAVAGSSSKPAATRGEKAAARKAKSKRRVKAAHATRTVAAAAKPAPASATMTAAYVETTPEPVAKGPAPLKGSRFLASGVPLAEVLEGRFRGAGTGKQPCGTKARWARSKSRWHALDAWGQVAGTLTVGGSERYDGTGCHQVWFAEGTGKDGLGVFVADGSGYTAGTSAEWKVDADHKKRFERLYSAQEQAWTEAKTGGSAARRTMFFRLPAHEAPAEGSPAQQRPVRWAVSGGRVLVIAYVGASGAWKVGHVLPPNGKLDAYEPLAVLDMNGDGLPEIVVHEEAGGVFADRVLAFDPASTRWETAVESPGGASR